MQHPLKILIVEDEMSFALDLEILVEELGYELIGITDNSEEVLAKILEQSPDLILMDISIKGKYSGIEIAEKIKHLPIAILFITSHKNKEIFDRAKSTNFAGYLVKPVDQFSIQAAIEMAVKTLKNFEVPSLTKAKQLATHSAHFFLKKQGTFYRVDVEEILWIGAEGNYINVATEERSYVILQSIQEVQKLLPDYFLQIHRSYIINSTKITSIDPAASTISILQQVLPISRRLKKDILQRLNFLH